MLRGTKMTELAYRTKEHVGNRRTLVWGGEWSLTALTEPVPADWPPAPPAPATPDQATEAPATEASASLHSGIRSLPSSSHLHGTAHLRPAVKVPVRLSLAGLEAVNGSVSVQVTICPTTGATSDVSVSFSYVEVGAVSVSPTLKRTGGTFTATFTCTIARGSTRLDFDFGGHSYRGRNSDHRDFSVTTEVTFQEHGKQTPTVLASSALLHL